ncbi:MAG: S-adenosylmethionine decarboxylase [Verrucomicrobia bacterium]|nr:S-adenosylmethionine decarboxylase [Verrucomicrobiota bacterium]
MSASTFTQEIPACEKSGYWGYHLILDCQGCDRTAIGNRENLASFVKTLVVEIDMKAFGEPVLEHFATHDADKSGYSLVQLIETSSITGHFVDKNGDAYIDIFSCKPFDIETAKSVVSRFFHPQKIKTFYLTRQA